MHTSYCFVVSVVQLRAAELTCTSVLKHNLLFLSSLNHWSLLMRKTVMLLSYTIFVHFQNGASIFIIQFETPLSSSFRRFLSSLSVVWRSAVRVRAGFYGMMLISLCVIAQRSGLWAPWRLLLSLLIALSLCLQKATRLAVSHSLHTHIVHWPLPHLTRSLWCNTHTTFYIKSLKAAAVNFLFL